MAIQDDISSGLYKIINKPFQVENLVYPVKYSPVLDANGDLAVFVTEQVQFTEGDLEAPVVGEYLVIRDLPDPDTTTWSYYKIEDAFDLDIYAQSGLTSFGIAVYKGDDFQSAALDLQFGVTISSTSRPGLTAAELAKIDNIDRIQWHDDDLHPRNSLIGGIGGSLEPPSIIGLGRDYFTAKRLDPAFDNILLSIDPPPFNYDSGEWTAYINALQPDLILHNNYPWQGDPANKRLEEYSMYARTIYWNGHAQAGGDVLNPTGVPIPFGVYLQTSWLLKTPAMPYSYRKYQAYFNLTFGAKYLAGFVYNDWPNDHNIGLESILFNENGVPVIDVPAIPTDQFYEQAELNRQLKNIGNSLRFLNPLGQRFIRATNIEEFNPQGTPFANGDYEWDYGVRPDTILTDIIVSRDDSATYQDVWVGYFNPIHNSLDGSGTTDESYFMICNGSWSEDNSIQQRIRLEFDFGADDTITSLLRLNKNTGRLNIVPLTRITGNTFYLEFVVKGGEAELFKYDNGVSFVGDPAPTVDLAESPTTFFNLPFPVRVSNERGVDADYYQKDIAGRNLLVTQGRAKPGKIVFVEDIGDFSSEVYILRGTSNADWQPIWKVPFQLADMYKQQYDSDNSGVVDNAELLSGKELSETNTANTVTERDEFGDIEARLFKSTFPNRGGDMDLTATVVMRNIPEDGDNFLRHVPIQFFLNWLKGANNLYQAAIFRTVNWEITEVTGILVFRTITGTVYQIQLPFGKTGTVLLDTNAITPVTPTNRIITEADLRSFTQKSAAYTIVNTDYIIEATANTFTLTLPTAVGLTGKEFKIKNSGTGVITIDGNGAETIDGELTKTLIQYEALTVASNGTNYIILTKKEVNKIYAFADLPTPSAGLRAFVSDSSLDSGGPNQGDIVLGGGANFVPVYADGTNWRIG